jgi:hypothetical protein
MLKIGDKLCCYKSECGSSILTCDSSYEIINIEIDVDYIRLCIFDDNYKTKFFTINKDEYGLSYENWFTEIKECRKNKLLEIENNI